MKEDSAVGEVVGRVVAVSFDIGANAKLKYSIVRGNEHHKFAIDRNTGEKCYWSKLDQKVIGKGDISNNDKKIRRYFCLVRNFVYLFSMAHSSFLTNIFWKTHFRTLLGR